MSKALFALGCTLVALTSFATATEPDKKPNVIFILADNVGYGDLGPYGGRTAWRTDAEH